MPRGAGKSAAWAFGGAACVCLLSLAALVVCVLATRGGSSSWADTLDAAPGQRWQDVVARLGNQGFGQIWVVVLRQGESRTASGGIRVPDPAPTYLLVDANDRVVRVTTRDNTPGLVGIPHNGILFQGRV